MSNGDLRRPQRSVVMPAPVTASKRWELERRDNLDRARAAALLCPRAAISHLSAGIAWGLPTLGADPACLTVPSGTALRRLAHVHLHRATLLDTDVAELDGLRLTAVGRTVTDIAREHGVRAGLVAADHALHEGLMCGEDLAASVEQCRGWPGRRAAVAVAAFADERAESPLESLSRLAMASRRLPGPTVQPLLCDEHGRVIGQPDFYWDEFGVVGECDGELKYRADATAIGREKDRHADFEQTGLIVVRWGWRNLGEFDAVAARLQAAYQRGAAPGSPLRRWGVVALHPAKPLTR